MCWMSEGTQQRESSKEVIDLSLKDELRMDWGFLTEEMEMPGSTLMDRTRFCEPEICIIRGGGS